MKKYKVSFHGRQAGAIGIFYNIRDTYKAKDVHELMSLLYEDYEHFGGKVEIYEIDEYGNKTKVSVPDKIEWVKVRSHNERERSPKTGSYKYSRDDAPHDYSY
jgi:hypothetical protein